MPTEAERRLTETSEAIHNFGPYDISRWPLVYLPRSTTQLNHERLPAPRDLADMDLSCREQAADDATTQAQARTTLFALIIGAMVTTVFALPALLLLMPRITLGLAGLAAIGLFGYSAIIKREVSLRLLLTCVAIPVFAVAAVALSVFVLQYRLMGTGLLMLIAAIAFWRFGHWPVHFYHDWLLAAPHITTEKRLTVRRPDASLEYGMLLLLIPLILLLPLLSPLLASAATVLLCAAFVAFGGFRPEFIPLAQDVFARFMTFRTLSGAPGTWQPRHTHSQRFRATLLLSFAVFGAVSMGLCFYFPARVVAEPLWPRIHAYALDHDASPIIDIQQHLRTWEGPLGVKQEAEGPRFLANAVIARPHLGPYLAVFAVVQGKLEYSWILLQGLFQLLVVPSCVLFAAYRPGLKALADTRKLVRSMEEGEKRPEWQWYVDRIRYSNHEARDPVTGRTIREAEHLFLGIESVQKFPVLLDKRILSEHAYLVGETGSGKTSLGIMPLLIQLLRGHVRPKTPDENVAAGASVGGWVQTAPPPVVIIDLKGDPALFHTVRKEVESRRKMMKVTDPYDPRYAFRFFTCEKGRPTHYFNPFLSLQTETRSLSQLCHLFLDSLSLSHGEGYGRSYYSRKNRMLLYEVLASEPSPRSFEELYERLKARVESQPRLYYDVFELVSTIHALSKYPQLSSFQPLKHPDQAIHMPSVLEYGQVAYFWLPAAMESISVREIAKLALFSFLTAAIDRQTQGLPRTQAYLVIDEFQRIAGENFKVVLEQARSLGWPRSWRTNRSKT
jgi:hypothetical protein